MLIKSYYQGVWCGKKAGAYSGVTRVVTEHNPPPYGRIQFDQDLLVTAKNANRKTRSDGAALFFCDI